MSGYVQLNTQGSVNLGGTSTYNNTLTVGTGTIASNEDCLTVGKYNKALNWAGEIKFIVGDGTDDNSRHNIFVVQNGKTHAPVIETGQDHINDFAEYFEWADGNPEGQDRVGYMVQLNGDKIELAQNTDDIIGVISATASVIGGACSLDWHGRFVKDVWGRELKDENGNKIVNPEYDKTRVYIPRSQRKEWAVVGMLGQTLVRQDGTLNVGKYAGCINGVATDATTGYKVLKVINNEIALILIR
jgi:hypothetical protein